MTKLVFQLTVSQGDSNEAKNDKQSDFKGDLQKKFVIFTQ